MTLLCSTHSFHGSADRPIAVAKYQCISDDDGDVDLDDDFMDLDDVSFLGDMEDDDGPTAPQADVDMNNGMCHRTPLKRNTYTYEEKQNHRSPNI